MVSSISPDALQMLVVVSRKIQSTAYRNNASQKIQDVTSGSWKYFALQISSYCDSLVNDDVVRVI